MGTCCSAPAKADKASEPHLAIKLGPLQAEGNGLAPALPAGGQEDEEDFVDAFTDGFYTPRTNFAGWDSEEEETWHDASSELALADALERCGTARRQPTPVPHAVGAAARIMHCQLWQGVA